MKCRILYYYSCRELQQVPNSKGEYTRDGYWKVDVAFKNFTSPITELTLNISLQTNGTFVKCACGQKFSASILPKLITVTKRNFKKSERINVDCFLANCHGHPKAYLKITTNDNNIALIKWPFLKMKGKRKPLLHYLTTAWRLLRSTVVKYSIKAIFGT
jgi:hypothetical protein